MARQRKWQFPWRAFLCWIQGDALCRNQNQSLCGGNIHLIAFYNAPAKSPSPYVPKLLFVQNWNHSLCKNKPSFSIGCHLVGQNLYFRVHLMMNYIKKLNRNSISNVDNILTLMKYLMKIGSQGTEFTHRGSVWDDVGWINKSFPKATVNTGKVSCALLSVTVRHPCCLGGSHSQDSEILQHVLEVQGHYSYGNKWLEAIQRADTAF